MASVVGRRRGIHAASRRSGRQDLAARHLSSSASQLSPVRSGGYARHAARAPGPLVPGGHPAQLRRCHRGQVLEQDRDLRPHVPAWLHATCGGRWARRLHGARGAAGGWQGAAPESLACRLYQHAAGDPHHAQGCAVAGGLEAICRRPGRCLHKHSSRARTRDRRPDPRLRAQASSRGRVHP